jgi:type IV pilus assembly protein PilE
MRTVGRRIAGFTLIELMIVVAVVAILSAVAYPSYQDQVRKSRRAQAKADLVEYAQLAERWHTTNNTYEGFTLPTNQSPREAGAPSRYGLVINTTQSTFTITATATSSGGQDKDKCGNLGINQAGVKTNSAGTLSDCW